VGYGEDSWTYKLGDVQFRGDMSSVSMAAGSQAEVGSRACQIAIGLRANVVVDVQNVSTGVATGRSHGGPADRLTGRWPTPLSVDRPFDLQP
jgi:hypothetical protein